MITNYFRRRLQGSRRGALIIEAMISILLFGMFATAAFGGLITGQESTQAGSDRVRGVYFAERGLEVAKIFRDQAPDFAELDNTADRIDEAFSLVCQGDCGVEDPDAVSTAEWAWDATSSANSLTDDNYQTTLDIEDLNIGILNRLGRMIVSTTTWKHGYFRPGNISLSLQLTDWRDFEKPIGNWADPEAAVETTNPLLPPGATDLGFTPEKLALSVDGQHVFATGNDLYVFDVGDDTPECVDPCGVSVGSSIKDLAVYNYRLFLLTSGNTIQGYDITNAADPTALEQPDNSPFPAYNSLPGTANTIFRHGPYLYVGLSSGGYAELQILDVSRSDAITAVGSAEIGATINDIFVMGNYVYLATSAANEVQVYDISDPTNPIVVDDDNNYTSLPAEHISRRGVNHYIGYPDDVYGVYRVGGVGGKLGGEVAAQTDAPVRGIDADPLGCFVFLTLSGLDDITDVPDPDPDIKIPYEDFHIWPGNADNWQATPFHTTTFPSSLADNPDPSSVLYNPWSDRVYVTAGRHFYMFQPQIGTAIDPTTCAP